jgi:tetraacyldisaccharide 4'-kinase
VPLDEPAWWYGSGARDGFAARALAPLGHAYGWIAETRFKRREPYRAQCPVICIGNFTAGGTGKTPLALLVAERLQAMGLAPVCLTRGYGGCKPGPAWVAPRLDTAHDVGDEPLLLAAAAPTMIARDRQAGARLIETEAKAGTVIVMDDGLQNPSLAKDLSIAVVDGARGLGNGRVIPAGPLRGPLDFQLGLVDCIVVNAPGEGTILDDLKRGFPGPVLAAETRPADEVSWLADAPVVAYAGIGHPERFFRLLERLGARVEARHAFPDHHPFTDADAERLLDDANEKGAMLVTTEKDFARLAGCGGDCGQLKARSRALSIRLAFDERDLVRLESLIEAAVGRGEPRKAQT